MKISIAIIIALNFHLCLSAQPGNDIQFGEQFSSKRKTGSAMTDADLKKSIREHLFSIHDHTIKWRTEKLIKLDSMIFNVFDLQLGIFYDGIKTSFEYTPDELLSSSTTLYLTYPELEIGYGSKELYTYNEFTKVSEYQYQIWNSNTMTWVKYLIATFEYDSEQKLIKTTVEDWYQDVLYETYRTSYTYNTADLLASETGSDWDPDTEEWVDTYKYDYAYTPFKQLQTETYSTISSVTMQWEFQSKTEYGYAQGKLLSATSYIWDGPSWINYSKVIYNYDLAGNLIKISTSVWDDVFPVWIDDSRYTNYYDASNRKISSSRYIWQMDQQLWEERDSTSIGYNEFNDVVDSTRFRWVYTGGGQWFPEEKIEYIFDTTVDFTEILWPVSQVNEEEITISKKLSSIITSEYYSPDSTWSPIESVGLVYSELSTGTPHISNEPFAVFPNPASGFIYLESDLVVDSDFEIYSLDGEKVKEMTIPADRRVSLSSFVPGTYFYLIRNSTEILTGKFIIQ